MHKPKTYRLRFSIRTASGPVRETFIAAHSEEAAIEKFLASRTGKKLVKLFTVVDAATL
jgi:hypothetical protein